MKTVFDLDDLCDRFDPYNELEAIAKKTPGFKVTMFAIPMLCSDELIAKYRAAPWVELAIHGFHHSSTECYDWSKAEAESKIDEALERFPATGFKAPGWVAGLGVYAALKEKGMWSMDHPEYAGYWCESANDRHIMDVPNDVVTIHGHTWETMDNGPSWWKTAIPKDANFAFVSEVVQPYKPFMFEQEDRTSWSHKSPWGNRAAKRLMEFVEKFEPKSMADFGGNDGYAAKFAKAAGVDITVVDGSPSRVAYAKREYGLKAVHSQFEAMPFEDDQFEWGFTSHTLEHVDDLMACWNEMKRVCRKGIYVVVPVETQEEFDRDPAHLRRHTKQEWADLLGLKPVNDQLSKEYVGICEL